MGEQLFMAAGYSSMLLMPLLLAFGVAVDLPYLAVAIATLVFPMMRIVFGAYRWRSPILWRESVATYLDRLPIGYGAVLFAAIACVIDRLAMGAVRSPIDAVWTGLSLWMTLLFATSPAHELIHRRKPLDAGVGWFIAGLAGYPLLGYEHLRHHVRHGDTTQAEWPRFAESAWSFASRRIRRIFVDAGSQGMAFWRPGLARGQGHRSGALVVTLLTWATFTWAGGWTGWLIYAGVIVGVTLGFQLINYLQHWGLGDDHLPGATERPMAWEDDCLFQSWLTLNISFHQSHHLSPTLPYYRLGLRADSPRPPAGYLILLPICMVPALWRRLMAPALAHWQRAPQSPQSPGHQLSCFSFYLDMDADADAGSADRAEQATVGTFSQTDALGHAPLAKEGPLPSPATDC